MMADNRLMFYYFLFLELYCFSDRVFQKFYLSHLEGIVFYDFMISHS